MSPTRIALGLVALAGLSVAVVGAVGCSRGTVDPTTVAAADGMSGTASEALETMRRHQYAGDAAPVTAFIAPVSWDMVIDKSNTATVENVERLMAGVYGYEVLAVQEDGDQACGILLVAQTDRGDPEVFLTPFYMTRLAGAWHYLPNPTEWDTWYHSLEDSEKAGFARLSEWRESHRVQYMDRTGESAAALIAAWNSGGS